MKKIWRNFKDALIRFAIKGLIKSGHADFANTLLTQILKELEIELKLKNKIKKKK